MEIKDYLEKKKEFYPIFIDFIDSDNEDADSKYQALITIIESQKILEDLNETKILLKLIFVIADNHYRTTNFFNKLEQIISYIYENSQHTDSISNIDHKIVNKRILYFLIVLEKEFFSKYEEPIEKFIEKCLNGQNETKICSLIQQDSIDEFIIYVNQTNFSLFNIIEPSLFETNPILNKENVSLIEYAAFYGSIQIVQYLVNNKVKLTDSLWSYAIHSNNPEMIDFLENKQIKPKSFENIFYESIQCHNSPFSDYIMDNLLTQEEIQNFNQYKYFNKYIYKSYNFLFYPEDISLLISINDINISTLLDESCLKSITIPSSSTLIGDNVFNGCSSLTQITFEIPSSISSIGNFSFYNCSNLTQITIPSSVTNIRNSAFYGCIKLIQITIPSSVTNIGNSAFYGCIKLIQITIPSSVISIGDHAFFGCSSLTQISIPSSVTSFGNNIIDGTKYLEIIGNIKKIPDNFMAHSLSITKIIMPSSVTSIGKYSFYLCKSLNQISIPSSVTEIENSAFYSCIRLTQITIPSSVNSIGSQSFDTCISLSQILFEIPSSLVSIGQEAFRKCLSLKQITIPSSVISIGKYAFYQCSSLTQISITSSIKSIESGTFWDCSSLTQITIPSSVTSIEDSAFRKCSSLKQITIPSSVTSIGKCAFFSCSSLTQILIPSSVTLIGDYAFDLCSSLTQMSVPFAINRVKIGLNSNVQISNI